MRHHATIAMREPGTPVGAVPHDILLPRELEDRPRQPAFLGQVGPSSAPRPKGAAALPIARQQSGCPPSLPSGARPACSWARDPDELAQNPADVAEIQGRIEMLDQGEDIAPWPWTGDPTTPDPRWVTIRTSPSPRRYFRARRVLSRGSSFQGWPMFSSTGRAVHFVAEQVEFGVGRHGAIAPGSAAIGLLAGRSPSLQSNPFRDPATREAGGVQGRRPLWRRPRSGFPCSLTGASGSGGFVAFAFHSLVCAGGVCERRLPLDRSCRGRLGHRSKPHCRRCARVFVVELRLAPPQAGPGSGRRRSSPQGGSAPGPSGRCPRIGFGCPERPRRPHEPGHRAGTNAEPRTRSPLAPVSGWASSRASSTPCRGRRRRCGRRRPQPRRACFRRASNCPQGSCRSRSLRRRGEYADRRVG